MSGNVSGAKRQREEHAADIPPAQRIRHEPESSPIIVPERIETAVKEAPKATGMAPSLVVPRNALVRDLVAAQLREGASTTVRNAFLPVTCSPDKAVLSELYRGNHPRDAHNYFQRSAAPLSDHVRMFSYAPLSPSVASAEPTPATWKRGEGEELSFEDKLVIDATLELYPSESNMQVHRLMVPYDPAVFDEFIMDAFNKNYPTALKSGILQDVDLTVEIFNMAMYVTAPMTILITACSTTKNHNKAITTLFPKLEAKLEAQSQDLVDNTEIYKMQPGRTRAFNLQVKEYGGSLSTEEFNGFSSWLKEAVHAASYDSNRNILMHFRLLKTNDIYVAATVFDDEDDDESWDGSELTNFPKFPTLPPTGLSLLPLEEVTVSITPSRMTTPAASLFDIADEPRAPPLVGLEGILILHQEHKEYGKYQKQYASFEGSYPDADFKPHFIARPKNPSEIQKIIEFAAMNNKKVVVRSGGHQYCGFSSGNEDYIQILMENMKDEMIKISSERALDVEGRGCTIVSRDKPADDDDAKQWFVTVAARCLLNDLSRSLFKAKLTIPHGECPMVGIGGHTQTGGYGHQMRGLGLCLDYVYSFDIIIYRNGNAEQLTVYRPEVQELKDPLNDELYKGVLGGSPGAFGVITRIKFLAVHDKDPSVAGACNVLDVSLYTDAAKVQQRAAEIVEKMLSFTLRTSPLVDGLDVFVSIISLDFPRPFPQSAVVSELAYTGKHCSADVKYQIDEIIGPEYDLYAHSPSYVAHKGVRTTGKGVTAEGREFNSPYKKRVNIMLGELSKPQAAVFAKKFGELCGKVIRGKDLKLVVQMNLGGGKAQSNDTEGRTGIPFRDQTFGFVFDIFYSYEGQPAKYRAEAKERAEDIQKSMQELLQSTGGFDNRVFWGSFGRENGETDMSKKNVQTWYYGNSPAYTNMQEIKKHVDPSGIFTTEFTVQNPPSPQE